MRLTKPRKEFKNDFRDTEIFALTGYPWLAPEMDQIDLSLADDCPICGENKWALVSDERDLRGQGVVTLKCLASDGESECYHLEKVEIT